MKKFLDVLAIFIISITISMPLISHWLGSKVYFIYMLSIIANIYIFISSKAKIRKIDFIFFSFILIILISSLYSVSNNYITNLLFVPLILFSYIGAKGIIYKNLLNVFMYIMSFLFLFFSIYLIKQLVLVGFNYNIYYHFSNAINKVDYLTMTLYASIVLFYFIFLINNKSRYIIIILISFIILISGARYSIFFLFIVMGYLFIKKINIIKVIIFIIMFSLIMVLNIDNMSKVKFIKQNIDIINFTINRLSHFNSKNASIEGRIYAIQHSIDAINNNIFMGYGLNSSPVIIHFIYPHNMFLEIWLDTGIFGFLLLLIFCILIIVFILKLNKTDKINIFLIITFLYLFFAHLKSFSIYHSPIFFLFSSLIIERYYAEKVKK